MQQPICTKQAEAAMRALGAAYSAGELSLECVEGLVQRSEELFLAVGVRCPTCGADKITTCLKAGASFPPFVLARLAVDRDAGVCSGFEFQRHLQLKGQCQ
jgi:hypothetical protein